LAAQPVVDLAAWRAVRLTERALAGDLTAAIAWLDCFGGEQWSLADMSQKPSYPT
jgi:hypothetical protein